MPTFTRGSSLWIAWWAVSAAGLAGGCMQRPSADSEAAAADLQAARAIVTGKHSSEGRPSPGVEPGRRFPIVVRRPADAPRIDLPESDPAGQTAAVACSTCHSIRQPRLSVRSPEELDAFHQGMTFQHGELTCYACHHPDDADVLRLADSTAVEYQEVMQLCAQCHGAQAAAYAHGAHGGMNGYWDRSQGPQYKNHCIDCHDPHAPAFPPMVVTFKPRDRFLNLSDHAAREEAPHDDAP